MAEDWKKSDELRRVSRQKEEARDRYARQQRERPLGREPERVVAGQRAAEQSTMRYMGALAEGTRRGLRPQRKGRALRSGSR
jgi:hypothetical protein